MRPSLLMSVFMIAWISGRLISVSALARCPSKTGARRSRKAMTPSVSFKTVGEQFEQPSGRPKSLAQGAGVAKSGYVYSTREM
jgi:hypothetical protein